MKLSRPLTRLLAACALIVCTQVYADEAPDSASVPATETNATVTGPANTADTAGPATKDTSDQPWYKKAWNTADKHLSDLWEKGDVELYVPFWTYHLPFAYSPSQRAGYTEYPAGGGLGKGWYNDSGNWEGVYLMGFQDSHGKPMYMGGYGWIPTWNPVNEKSRIGVGATVFMFMRSDINYYAPTPGILPMGTIGYGPIDVQVAYIPGGQGYGNVLFWWAKYSFK